MIDCSKAETYLVEKRRMTEQQKDGTCKLECADCPLSIENNGADVPCSNFEMLYPKKAIAIMQKWSDEHPQKTYLSEFLKTHPSAMLDNDGTPAFCPYRLGLMDVNDCRKDGDCVKCWNQPVENNEEGEKND